MKTSRKVLSLLLTTLLILTLIPISVFAEGNAAENGTGGSVTATPAGTLSGAESGTLIYNLGKREVTVTDFNGDDSYTIQLEDNAFFPYEVQFKYDGQTSVKTFDTPDSTVTVGGHVISVTSNYDDDAISQIGVYVNGEYIAATPAKKTFTNSMVAPFSLLPLQKIDVDLDLSQYDRFELKNVGVSAILGGLVPTQVIGAQDKVVWAQLWNDDYHKIVTQADSIDLSIITYNPGRLELIVGSALQLDSTNTRYIVSVTVDNSGMSDGAELYVENDGVRSTAVFARDNISGSLTSQSNSYYLNSDAPAQTYYLGLKVKAAYSGYTVKAIEGSFSTADEAIEAATANPERDVTDKVIDQTMTNTGTGLALSFDPLSSIYERYTLVFFDGATAVGSQRVYVYIGVNTSGIEFNWLYTSDGSDVVRNTNPSNVDGIQVRTSTMYSQYPADANYYLRLQYRKDGVTDFANRSYVTKAVLGHYNTLESAEGQTDISGTLFPVNDSDGSGYLANYSGDGQKFTVFAEGEVYKFTIKAIDGVAPEIDEPLPNPGSRDTYFRMYGANELSNTYVLPYEHDSYYDMGYQTVFYTDDVALSALTPYFDADPSIHVYSGHSGNAGTLQESGVTVQDFSNGPVQYSAAAENGRDLKNYWVTFVKKHIGGAKLFVNGINGEDGAKREVFLTSIHDHVHDIFIANVGDAQLEGLTATLTNEQNIKLDPYWTVGGANNDTLAAFTSAWTSSYSELANVAKIRLVPDGEGAISGTLTISATGQEPVVITLTGNAGDPKLTTTDIPDAVKFVPYAAQIVHNNKYSWNTVTLECVDGALPMGVSLKPNGELYGVPMEAGTFTFEVEMTNSDTRFDDSSAIYTLVVADNTDENVEAQIDPGYTILNRIPALTSLTPGNKLFRSEGDFNEFIDFWIDGNKLERGVHYDVNEGSTAITIRSQTFQQYGTGTHTIAAEFRVGGNMNDELKRTAQNYTLDTSGGSSGDGGGSSGGGGGSSGGSGGSSGGGSGSNGSGSNTASQPTVNPVTAAQQTTNEPLQKLTFKLKDVNSVSLADLKEFASISKKSGKTPWLNVDTMSEDGKSVDVRVGINPALAQAGLNLAGSTYSARALQTGLLFNKFFTNEFAAVISLMQKGEFGQPATICVKVPEGTDVETLAFYSYDAETNTYKSIKDTNARIDQNGYLHFTTTFANDIIISYGELKRK